MIRKAWYKKWWIWVILGIVSVLFFGIVGACSDEVVEEGYPETSIVEIGDTTAIQITKETEPETKQVEKTTIKETEIETMDSIETQAEEITEVETYYPSCSSVNRIKSNNREDYYGTSDELVGMGYEACKKCNP